MTNICNAVIPAGAVDCKKLLGKIDYMIIQDRSFSFANPAAFVSLATYLTAIREDLNSHLIKIIGYDVTTDDPNIITLPNTRKIVSNEPIPSMMMNADYSFCDSQNLVKTLNGGTYRVVFITSDNEFLAFQNGAGVIKGFSASVKALTKGLQTEADPEKTVTTYVNFDSYDEFVASVVAVPDWNVGIDLEPEIPVGLNMYATGAYATSELPVQINERCGDGHTGLVTADFVIIRDSGLTTPSITAVEVANGAYTLTIEKEVTTELAAGDSITFQVQKKTGDVIDYISQQYTLNVV